MELFDRVFGAGEPAPAVEAAGVETFAGDVAVAAARHCATYAFSVVVLPPTVLYAIPLGTPRRGGGNLGCHRLSLFRPEIISGNEGFRADVVQRVNEYLA
jgi:hypothetical protein